MACAELRNRLGSGKRVCIGLQHVVCCVHLHMLHAFVFAAAPCRVESIADHQHKLVHAAAGLPDTGQVSMQLNAVHFHSSGGVVLWLRL
jgi:hypothetical protein